MSGSFSPTHWLIVAIVVLVLFAPSKISGLGKELGKGIREFKNAVNPTDNTTTKKS